MTLDLASYQGQQEIAAAIENLGITPDPQRSLWFDNVATMRQADLPVGVTSSTRGYYAVNDGGSAFYYVREPEVGDVDDGGSIIILDNGNVAELITDGTVNVKQFGAKGDGATDDIIPIQHAVNTGLQVYIYAGNYKITSPIMLNGFKSLTAFGTINATGDWCFDVSGMTNKLHTYGNAFCKNFLRIIGDATYNKISYGIIYIYDTYGLYIDISSNMEVTHNQFSGERISASSSSEPQTYGLYLKSIDASYINGNLFENVDLYRCATAIYFESTSSNSSNDNMFYGISPEGSTLGVHLKGHVQQNVFYDLRNNEMTNLIKTEGAYGGNEFFTPEAVKSSMINCTNSGENIINHLATSTGAVYWSGRIAFKNSTNDSTKIEIYPKYALPEKVYDVTDDMYYSYGGSGSSQYHQYTILRITGTTSYNINLDSAYGDGKISEIKLIVPEGMAYPKLQLKGTSIIAGNNWGLAQKNEIITVTFAENDAPIINVAPLAPTRTRAFTLTSSYGTVSAYQCYGYMNNIYGRIQITTAYTAGNVLISGLVPVTWKAYPVELIDTSWNRYTGRIDDSGNLYVDQSISVGAKVDFCFVYK